jgi:hypothetical protein
MKKGVIESFILNDEKKGKEYYRYH